MAFEETLIVRPVSTEPRENDGIPIFRVTQLSKRSSPVPYALNVEVRCGWKRLNEQLTINGDIDGLLLSIGSVIRETKKVLVHANRGPHCYLPADFFVGVIDPEWKRRD